LSCILKNICEIIPQYNVLNYRIDFYLPKYNLAIEYDEHAHLQRIKEDKKRQSEIKEILNCEFIRIEEGAELHGINKIITFILNYKKQ